MFVIIVTITMIIVKVNIIIIVINCYYYFVILELLSNRLALQCSEQQPWRDAPPEPLLRQLEPASKKRRNDGDSQRRNWLIYSTYSIVHVCMKIHHFHILLAWLYFRTPQKCLRVNRGERYNTVKTEPKTIAGCTPLFFFFITPTDLRAARTFQEKTQPICTRLWRSALIF